MVISTNEVRRNLIGSHAFRKTSAFPRKARLCCPPVAISKPHAVTPPAVTAHLARQASRTARGSSPPCSHGPPAIIETTYCPRIVISTNEVRRNLIGSHACRKLPFFPEKRAFVAHQLQSRNHMQSPPAVTPPCNYQNRVLSTYCHFDERSEEKSYRCPRFPGNFRFSPKSAPLLPTSCNLETICSHPLQSRPPAITKIAYCPRIVISTNEVRRNLIGAHAFRETSAFPRKARLC